jgi:hypothetical protein
VEMGFSAPVLVILLRFLISRVWGLAHCRPPPREKGCFIFFACAFHFHPLHEEGKDIRYTFFNWLPLWSCVCVSCT